MQILPRVLFTTIASALVLGGCVSVSPQALREKPRADSLRAIVGTFENSASYHSTAGLVATDTLSFELGMPLVRASTVKVTRPTGSQLKLEFKAGQSTEAEKTYVDGAGMTIGPQGTFEISVPVGCGGHDSPGFGCGNKTVTLFLNSTGDLAAVESGSAAGVLGIFPFAMYSKQLAIFARLFVDD